MRLGCGGFGGLTSAEAKRLLAQYGRNELAPPKKESLLRKALHIFAEPMFVLLLAAAVIYFILGEPRDGLVMLVFVMGIIGIDVMQQWKTNKTLQALKDLSAPQITALRDGEETLIPSAELVPGDVMMIHEGVKIPADGFIVRCADLCVDESTLTGEAEGVWKTASYHHGQSDGFWRNDYCYAGTLVTQGSGVVCVERTGASTQYGRIGSGIASAPQEKTPLERQTGFLVKLCMGIAAVLMALVSGVTYLNLADIASHDRIIASVLSGITLAMAMIPEEFPVILTVFLSMGAWRLAKKRALVRRLHSVETLGAVSVLCVDKTGTITLNRMTVEEAWPNDGDEANLIEVMGLACETDAYDPMEKAMLSFCEEKGITKTHLFGGRLISEYAFTHELKMMGHIWYHDDEIVIAAKGSPERVVELCALTDEERTETERRVRAMSEKGLRVIAVASMKPESREDVPDEITGCALELRGLIGLADPPREGVKRDIARCERAGVRTVMITGDNGITAASIAKRIGMPHTGVVTGDMIEGMDDETLRERVRTAGIFSRVTPEHKMRVVKALKEGGEIVAMTGDGVNDAPAIKRADIGIAMGGRGSEVTREAADLIIMDDNFSTIVDTVKDGRRIYDNIRKSVGYVLAIHIPIAAASLLAPVLGISAENLLLLPLHVVLLELIVDPTCSIVLERQPAEYDIMEREPRDPGEKIIGPRSLLKSAAQGMAVFAASFGLYLGALIQNPESPSIARSMGLAVIVLANLFLVQVNSSDRDSILVSIKRLARDKVMWAVNIITLAGLAAILYTPLSAFLKLEPLSLAQLLTVLALAAASVLWYEVVKLVRRRSARR